MAAAPDRAALAHELVKSKADGRVKLFVIHEGARAFAGARTARCSRAGAYRPLESRGAWSEHVCAFARTAGDAAAMTIIPAPAGPPRRRRACRSAPSTGPTRGWSCRASWPGATRNVFTGEPVETAPAGDGAALPLADVLTAFPVALLAREAAR